jgi:RND superfamily putative drug exporter
VAALLPLLVGVFSIFGSLLVMFILTKFTSVSIYALNLTTMMGLGLAIDYSLFIVSRFREQLAKGDKVELAVKRTVISAGRTVLFSAFTVAVSLAALMVFKQPFLRSFAFAGVAVSIVASIGSLLLLPAILMLLGERINAWPVGKKVSYEKGSKFWHRVALIVMDRPIVVALSVIAVLFVLGQPFFSINLGRGDERSLPKTNPVRIVHEDIRKNFSSRETSALQVVTATNANVNEKTITDYAAELSKVQGVDHVESSYGVYASGLKVSPLAAKNQLVPEQGTYFSVVPNVEPFSKDGEKLTKALRALPAPFKVYVGGSSADLTDLKASIFSRLPWAILMISITTFILLFMMFGGLLVPIKALVINFMSLSATFGAMVWIFQQGHLSGLLNFTATGMIDATMPILMFCVAFGLSMDYEVFLLSRIKEHHDKHGNNRDAVAHGLEKTGGIVTAAALSISVVFLAFATSGVTLIKLFGLGLALAVLLDAFVIRGTLVPAFMRLAGDANWWAPKPLAKFYKRFGITEID